MALIKFIILLQYFDKIDFFANYVVFLLCIILLQLTILSLLMVFFYKAIFYIYPSSPI